MKKLLSLWACIFALLQFANAQGGKKIEYTVGTPYKVVDANSKNYYTKGNEMLSIKIYGYDLYVQKYNLESLSQTWIKTTKKAFASPAVIENVFERNGRFYILYGIRDKANDNESVWIKEISWADGTVVGTDRKIFSTEGRVTGPAWFSAATNKYDVYYASDDSKVLIQYRRIPEKRKDAVNYDNIGLFVYDENWNTIGGGEMRMPYTEKQMDNLDYSVDADGNIYILAKVYNDPDSRKEDEENPNYRIEVLRLVRGTKEIQVKPIELDDKFIHSVAIFEGASDEQMLCAGFYNKGKKSGASADGLMVFRLDKEGNAVQPAYHEFPLELINAYQSRREKNKNEKKEHEDRADFANLVMRNVVVGSDGSTTLVGEQYYVVVTRYYDANSKRWVTRYTYYFNDILVAKINADGSLAWMKRLGKRQVGAAGRGGLGFKYFYADGEHYFLFLDNINNLNITEDDVPKYHQDGRGGFLTAYAVNHESGAVDKLSGFDMRDVNGMAVYQFNTNRITGVPPSEAVVEVYKKKKEDILIKLKLSNKRDKGTK